MSEDLRDVSDRDTLCEQNRRARMPERMKRQSRQALCFAVLALPIDDVRMAAAGIPADPCSEQQALQVARHIPPATVSPRTSHKRNQLTGF